MKPESNGTTTARRGFLRRLVLLLGGAAALRGTGWAPGARIARRRPRVRPHPKSVKRTTR